MLRHEFSQAVFSGSDDAAIDQIVALTKNDLQFLIPLLRSFPKCYWIWNYRMWLLDEAKRLLPLPLARRIWQEELALVGKMLSLDSRNFHGWGYRRFVVQTLETLPSEGTARTSMAPEEFEYANKMVGNNLSNFSAWHYRTKLIQRLLNEKSASDEERKKMLDDGKLSALAVLPCANDDGNRIGTYTSRTVRPIRSISLVLPPEFDEHV